MTVPSEGAPRPDDDGGRVFRQAWIDGVREHYPGQPKDSYITPWEDTPDWERAAATAVYRQIRDFLAVTAGAAARLSPVQKGRFVALCWTGQMYRHFPEPKPAYVADWESLPEWQRLTDSGIFAAVEAHAGGRSHASGA